jgi:hypothetical protein
VNSGLTKHILEVCNTLNKNGVQYLIIGGTAVAFHGYFRWSYTPSGKLTEKFDLDIWYNPTYSNFFNLLTAMEELGQDVQEFREEESPNPMTSYFQLDLAGITIDFLPILKGLSEFGKSFAKKEIVNLQGTDIIFIDFDDLIKDKSANSRPKDLMDIKELKAKRKDY